MTDFAARDADNSDFAEDDSGGTTLLSDVLGELQEKVRKPLMTEPVPGRPGFAVRLDTNVDFRKIQAMTKACWDKKLDAIDRTKFAATVVINHCVAVLKDGKELADDDGTVLTFRSSVWMDVYGVIDRISAVKEFFGEVDLILLSDKFQAVSGTSTGAQDEADPLS